jgi:hypothetical protein
MHYYLFHPSFRGAFDDNADLTAQFMGIGKSFSHAMELGTEKIRTLEADEAQIPLIALIESMKVTVIEKKYASLMERVISRFGSSLQAQTPGDKGKLSMIALLLHRGRYDVIEQIVDAPTMSAAEFRA